MRRAGEAIARPRNRDKPTTIARLSGTTLMWHHFYAPPVSKINFFAGCASGRRPLRASHRLGRLS